MSRYKPHTFQTDIESALETFYADIEGLAEEVREVVDSAPEGLANSPRIETMSETADTLEGIQSTDLPEDVVKKIAALEVALGEAEFTSVSVTHQVRGGKKRGQESRAVRRDNACASGRAVVDSLREWAEADTDDSDEHQEAREEASTFADELEAQIDEAEGCEFPGMRG